MACGIWFLRQGLNLGPLYWGLRVTASGPPGRSLDIEFYLGFGNVLTVGATFLKLDTLLLLIWPQVVFRLFFS